MVWSIRLRSSALTATSGVAEPPVMDAHHETRLHRRWCRMTGVSRLTCDRSTQVGADSSTGTVGADEVTAVLPPRPDRDSRCAS